MTEKELKRLNRKGLLEVLIQQSKKIDELEAELKETRAKLESRQLEIQNAGSLAEAAVQLSGVMEAAQQAADVYLENIRRMAEQSRPLPSEPVGENSEAEL